MKSMILALLIATISFNSYAQVKQKRYETGNKENGRTDTGEIRNGEDLPGETCLLSTGKQDRMQTACQGK